MKLIKTAVAVAMFVAAGAAFAGPGMGHGNHQPGERIVKAISDDGRLVAIGEARLPSLYHPVVVL